MSVSSLGPPPRPTCPSWPRPQPLPSPVPPATWPSRSLRPLTPAHHVPQRPGGPTDLLWPLGHHLCWRGRAPARAPWSLCWAGDMTRVQAVFPGLGRLQPCCGVSPPRPPSAAPAPGLREPHAPSVGAEEVAPLLPRAPGPSCSGPRCKWLLVSVLCACSPASSGGCLVPGGTTFLPRALHTKNGIETGWPGCFLKFPFLLVAFCPRGPGESRQCPGGSCGCVGWVSGGEGAGTQDVVVLYVPRGLCRLAHCSPGARPLV